MNKKRQIIGELQDFFRHNDVKSLLHARYNLQAKKALDGAQLSAIKCSTIVVLCAKKCNFVDKTPARKCSNTYGKNCISETCRMER